ncbi:MAG: nuclear transport factor 2 family protein [Desulfobacteraceae bacterium]|nr:nuclear transport factor 2 family protein [Desulfobacteraceae bacterium]
MSEREFIRQAVLDYIEAWYEQDAPRGERRLHPDLVKRIVRTDPETGRDYLELMSAEKLADRWRSGDGKKTPKEDQQKDVTILDIFGKMASVKLETTNWVDYMQLAKYDGKWLIVNILWELKS